MADAEYGEMLSDLQRHRDKLQWRTRVRDRARDSGKMKAKKMSTRATNDEKDYHKQWVVRNDDESSPPPIRPLQCGTLRYDNDDRGGHKVEYLQRRGDGGRIEREERRPLECNTTSRDVAAKAIDKNSDSEDEVDISLMTSKEAWVEPLRGRVFPDKRLGEKLDVRSINLGDGTAFPVTFRELELFLMSDDHRSEFTDFKKDIKKKRASFEDMLRFYESRSNKPPTKQAFIKSLKSAKVRRAYKDGKWQSGRGGRGIKDAPTHGEVVIDMGGGEGEHDEYRHLKKAKPTYVVNADRQKTALRRKDNLLSRRAFKDLVDLLVGDGVTLNDEAYGSIQDALESYLTHLFYGANRIARLDRRPTVLDRDLYNAMRSSEPKSVRFQTKNEKRVMDGDKLADLVEDEAKKKVLQRLLPDAAVKRLAHRANIKRVGSGFIEMARRVTLNEDAKTWIQELLERLPDSTSKADVETVMKDHMKWEMA